MSKSQATEKEKLSFRPGPIGDTTFSLGSTEYGLSSVQSGYTLKAYNEHLTITYNKGVARIEFSDGSTHALLTYNFSELPEVTISLEDSKKTQSATGTAAKVAHQISKFDYPKMHTPSLAKLFRQFQSDRNFRGELTFNIIPRIPFKHYGPHFMMKHPPKVFQTADGSCQTWCWLCGLALAGAPEDAPVIPIPCAVCLACVAGPLV